MVSLFKCEFHEVWIWSEKLESIVRCLLVFSVCVFPTLLFCFKSVIEIERAVLSLLGQFCQKALCYCVSSICLYSFFQGTSIYHPNISDFGYPTVMWTDWSFLPVHFPLTPLLTVSDSFQTLCHLHRYSKIYSNLYIISPKCLRCAVGIGEV